MAFVKYYVDDPFSPYPNQPNHYGSNIIIRYKDSILLEHRKDNFTWGLLGGGIHLDESFLDCGIREVKEESGIVLKPSNVHFFQLYDNPKRIVSFLNGSVYRVITMVYSSTLSSLPDLTCSEESLELKFIPIKDLPKYEIVKTHEQIIIDYLESMH